MHATFEGGPADGMHLQVRGAEAYIAVIDGVPVEVPDHNDEDILNEGWRKWVLYVADGEISGDGRTRYVVA